MLLARLHPYLKKHGVDHDIFILEQASVLGFVCVKVFVFNSFVVILPEAGGGPRHLHSGAGKSVVAKGRYKRKSVTANYR